MKYLLDTDTCIHVLRESRIVAARLASEKPSGIAVSVITEGELRVGVVKHPDPPKAGRLIDAFLAALTVLPFDSHDARRYGDVRATLERAGRKIGPLDTLIAAQAVARGLILVTGNHREFARVPGLTVESWSAVSAS